MMIPVIYEQLKWEKLKIQKARCVCVRACVLCCLGAKGGQQEVPLQGLGVIWEPQLLFCEDLLAPVAQACLVPTFFA